MKEKKGMSHFSRFMAAVLCSGLITAGGMSLEAQMVQRDIQAQIMLKIVSLDRNFERYGETIRIGVTSEPMLSALKRFSSQTIKGRSFTVSLLTQLEEVGNFSIVYIDKNWKGNYSSVLEIAAAKKILMFVGEPEAVERGEGGIGFKTLLGNPKIAMNLEVVKQQGANFPANFLQMTLMTGNI